MYGVDRAGGGPNDGIFIVTGPLWASGVLAGAAGVAMMVVGSRRVPWYVPPGAVPGELRRPALLVAGLVTLGLGVRPAPRCSGSAL